jgi:dimeric dUTPase (all-alpha-NTP-PPase superfamily)
MNCEKLFILNISFNEKIKPEERIRIKDVVKEVFKVKDGEIVEYNDSLYTSSLKLSSSIDANCCRLFAKYASVLDFIETITLNLYDINSGYSIYFERESKVFTVDKISLIAHFDVRDDKRIKECFERKFSL